MAADKAALILFRALPEFKACAPWIQDLAEAAFIRGMEEGKRQCGPGMPQPPRYTLRVYLDADYEFMDDRDFGDWVKWDDISSLFATGSEGSK